MLFAERRTKRRSLQPTHVAEAADVPRLVNLQSPDVKVCHRQVLGCLWVARHVEVLPSIVGICLKRPEQSDSRACLRILRGRRVLHEQARAWIGASVARVL